MTIKISELMPILETVAPASFDEPEVDSYPFIICEFVNESYRRASNKVLYEQPLYFITYVTKGSEGNLRALKDALNKHNVSYSQFEVNDYDENDESVKQYSTYVRCINEN